MFLVPIFANPVQHFEWGGIFDVDVASPLIWVAQKIDGAYAETSMKLVVIAETDSAEASFETSKNVAHTLFAGICTNIIAGATIVPSLPRSRFFDLPY
jgi:hypothetical protein